MSRTLRNDRTAGIFISVLAHAAVIVCGGFAFAKPVQYAVVAGTGGIEVSLTAAPSEQDPNLIAAPLAEEAENESPPDKAKIGAASASGTDKITFHSLGGALTESQPNYLKNPAPPYPFQARQKGWEGVVLLRVQVAPSGRALKVDKEKSSGYAVLDDSALRTVKKWRFRPAYLGSLAVETSVLVPVRFELERKDL